MTQRQQYAALSENIAKEEVAVAEAATNSGQGLRQALHRRDVARRLRIVFFREMHPEPPG